MVRIAARCLVPLSALACSLLPLPGPAAAQAPAPAERVLAGPAPTCALPAGSWLVAELTFDGEPRHDDEMSGSRLTFAGDRLTIENSQQLLEFSLRLEPAARPCAFLVTPVAAPGEPSGVMLFALAGAELKLGFHDNLARRPASFDARPDMVVLRLVPAP